MTRSAKQARRSATAWLNRPVFEGISTERLTIRSSRPDDATALAHRRSDPKVAQYQDWELPYPGDRAEKLVEAVMETGSPTDGAWWMAQVTLEDDHPIGDLAIKLSEGGRTAEIGYTFAPEHWGRGYAAEAVEGLIPYLFEEVGVTRIGASVHPDNAPSARVLERNGFLYEGHTRSSHWIRGEVAGDCIFGLLREDWDTWRNRPRHRPEAIELIEVTTENESKVYRLRTHKTQQAFVAPMKWSYSDALFPEIVDGAPVVPWMRAVRAEGVLVGFVMLALVTEHHPEPYLWRLLVDRLHQRRGIGSMIMDVIEQQCRDWGHDTLITSWGEGRGSPRPFYEGRGFMPTGRIVDDETEARKQLR